MDWSATYDPVWSVRYLPSNSTTWENVVDAADADLVARDPVGLVSASRNVADAPLEWLPYLAAERSVDEFSGNWSEVRQRGAVRGSFPLHQRKGTRRALELAMATIGYATSVREWFEPYVRRDPYTFRLEIDLGIEPWLGENRSTLIRVANGSKNAHTKLEAIELSRRLPGYVYVGGIIRTRRIIRVGQLPKVTTIFPPDARIFVGVALRRRRTLRIHQRTGT